MHNCSGTHVNGFNKESRGVQRDLQRFSRKVFGYLLASCMRMLFGGPGRIVGHLRGGIRRYIQTKNNR